MIATLAEIWRYPIKAHGRELIRATHLVAGQAIAWDRHWAVVHEHSDADGSEWVSCVNFNRGAKAPALMALDAVLDVEAKRITLSHPEKPDLCFSPDSEADVFLEWVRPLIPEGRAKSVRIISVPKRGVTDTDYPSISLINRASNADLEAKIGGRLDMRRWRGNFILEGLSAWQEFELVGNHVQIGEAVLAVREPIKRCLATTANPETGIRDADTLGALKRHYGHQHFGVYAEVIEGGRISAGVGIKAL